MTPPRAIAKRVDIRSGHTIVWDEQGDKHGQKDHYAELAGAFGFEGDCLCGDPFASHEEIVARAKILNDKTVDPVTSLSYYQYLSNEELQMNKEKIAEVRDWIMLAQPQTFNMGNYISRSEDGFCGTAGCIATMVLPLNILTVDVNILYMDDDIHSRVF